MTGNSVTEQVAYLYSDNPNAKEIFGIANECWKIVLPIANIHVFSKVYPIINMIHKGLNNEYYRR